MESNKRVVSKSDSKKRRFDNDSANPVHECGEIGDIERPSSSTTDDQTMISFPDPRLILDHLPAEILQNDLFQYLSCEDISALSSIGSKRMKEISEDYIRRNCTRILIAGGKVRDETVSSAYILQIHFQPNSNNIKEVILINPHLRQLRL